MRAGGYAGVRMSCGARGALDESGLARLGELLVEVVGGELDGARGSRRAGESADQGNTSHLSVARFESRERSAATQRAAVRE